MRKCSGLRNQILHDMPVHIGEAVVAALEAVGQVFVIEAELVEDRCLEVVDMNALVGDAEAQFVGRPVVVAALYAAAPMSRKPSRQR